jgi:hypothetical protein
MLGKWRVKLFRNEVGKFFQLALGKYSGQTPSL